MAHRIYVGFKPHHRDAHGEHTYQSIIQDAGISTLVNVRCVDVYILEGSLSIEMLDSIARSMLSDPVTQRYTIDSSFISDFDWMVEVGKRPGVTDNTARVAREVISCARQRDGEDVEVYTARQFFMEGTVSREALTDAARGVLANELIETMAIYSAQQWMEVHEKPSSVPAVDIAHEIIPFREIPVDITNERLMELSRDQMLALSEQEMRAIRAYYTDPATLKKRREDSMPANPTDTELQILGQTWSEHCKHKIFNARITYHENGRDPQQITSLFRTYIAGATRQVQKNRGSRDICLSIFSDNAGVIRFDDEYALVFKVETHNSPSALDPYGGALTGIVGVNRDPFGTGMGCRLIANTDVFCFASPFYKGTLPPRILHPKRIFEGVRRGVEHGGNKSGIPTINGCVVFDDRYMGKPLVYCGTLGLMPQHTHGRKGWEKKAQAGDHIIMTGGRIGKDGIHGATFSSEALHEGSPSTAVQIGDPITQKRMTDFLLVARDKGLYNSITDNGAGGLSSSVGEMAQDTNGAKVYVDRAPLKYPGLEPWEIFLSEAQERMTLAVPPDKVEAFMEMAHEWAVEASDLGEFCDSGYLDVWYHSDRVAHMDMTFLHDGVPKMELTARWQPRQFPTQERIESDDPGKDLCALLGRLNICSKEYIVRQYDHEVQGGSVVKPLTGAHNDGPSDAAVIRPYPGSASAAALSNGIIPRYSDIDAYAMAACSCDEAVRNAVCVGADPDYIAALDNFCWCDPVQSEKTPDGEYKLGQLVRANQALHDVCLHYNMALISGKDSMKNDYHIGDRKISIPPTLLVSVIARLDKPEEAITMDLKSPGNALYIIGTTWRDMGASEYALMKEIEDGSVPQLRRPSRTFELYRSLHRAIQGGVVRSCHDCSDGGLGVALAEMCFSGATGADIFLSRVPRKECSTDTEVLFSETPGRILVEVAPGQEAAFEHFFSEKQRCTIAKIGSVTDTNVIRVAAVESDTTRSLEVSLRDAKSAWHSPLQF